MDNENIYYLGLPNHIRLTEFRPGIYRANAETVKRCGNLYLYPMVSYICGKWEVVYV